MLLDRLSVTVLAAASIFGTSWAWPAILSTEPRSIKHANHADNDDPSQSSGSISRRIPHGVASRRSVLEALKKDGSSRTRLERRKPNDQATVRTLLESPGPAPKSKGRLARRASLKPTPDSVWLVDGIWFTIEDYKEYIYQWGHCTADRFRTFRQASPERRKFLIRELEAWFADRPIAKPPAIDQRINLQCEQDGLEKIRWGLHGKQWPGRPVWDEAKARHKTEWEERNAEEIARQDPSHTALTSYWRKVEMGLSNLPQAARHLASSVQEKAPALIQAAGTNMARFDAAATLRKVKVKPVKGPILL